MLNLRFVKLREITSVENNVGYGLYGTGMYRLYGTGSGKYRVLHR